MDIEGIISDYIATELLAPQGRAQETVTPQTSLFRTGIVDSFGLLAMVQYLEHRFGVVVRDEEMVPENFDSVSTIARFVRSKQQAGDAAGRTGGRGAADHA